MTSSFTPDVIYDFMWRNFYEEKPFLRRLIMLTIIYTIINGIDKFIKCVTFKSARDSGVNFLCQVLVTKDGNNPAQLY